MTNVTIREQELFGQTHYRVMRDDGQKIFDRIQTDFPTLEDAELAIEGEFRRKKLGECNVRIVRRTPDGPVGPAIS